MNSYRTCAMNSMASARASLRGIAIVGPHPARHCKVGHFSAGLCDALNAEYPDTHCSILAVNGEMRHGSVGHVIQQQSEAAYRKAAQLLNDSEVEVVCLQHGSGVFGASGGALLREFLHALEKPLVTTFHSVEPDPSPDEHRVMDALFKASSRLVTLTVSGRDMLRESYDVPLRKMDVIPYGITDAPVLPSNPCKDAVGFEGRSVLLTSGQLAPGKGIEHVIQALPSVIRQYPDVLYVVVGVTQHDALQTDGETYRRHLEDLARACGVSDHVLFVDRFVDDEELDLYISAADICLTPYDVECRTCSSTLSRMVGMGKAVVSTPYLHARELLADGRGRLVRFASPMAIATAVLELLNDSTTVTSIRQRAWAHSRTMVWPRIAQAYMQCFQSVVQRPGAIQLESTDLLCNVA